MGRFFPGLARILVFMGVLVAETTTATAGFVYPLDLAVAPDGTVYVADRSLPGIWKIQNGKPQPLFIGKRTFRTPLNAVRCVAVDSQGRVYTGDSATREVYRFDDGKPVPLTGGKIGIPNAIAIADDQTLYIANLEDGAEGIWGLPADGEAPQRLVELAGIRDLIFDKQGHLLVVTNLEDPVRRVHLDGSMEVVVAGTPFEFPQQIVIDESGTLFVTDNYADCIWKVPVDGEPEKWVQGEPMQRPVGLAWQGENLLVADPHARQLFRVNPQGEIAAFPPQNE